MKKAAIERGLAIFLVFVAFLVSWYLYKEGKISFLPQKNKSVKVQNMIAEIPYAKKEYKLSYEKYPADDVAEIAFFEDSENWKGDGEFDFSSVMDGESSLFLSSKNNYKATASLKLNKEIYLDDYINVKMFVNLKNENSNIENFIIKFTNDEGSSIFYPIRQLNPGWNLVFLELDKFTKSNESGSAVNNSFGKINEISFELVSRPKSTVSINLDSLWLEKNEDYHNDWNMGDYKYLAVRKDKERTVPYFIGLTGTVATLKEIGSAKDFSFIVKFKPLSQGYFGLFLRGDYRTGFGYYFITGGVGTNNWQISKYGSFGEETKNVELVKGEIGNFRMEKNKDYFLKGELKGNNLDFFVSLDGVQYTKLGGVNDSSFISGGIGIVTRGTSFTVDDISFFQ